MRKYKLVESKTPGMCHGCVYQYNSIGCGGNTESCINYKYPYHNKKEGFIRYRIWMEIKDLSKNIRIL